jgi:hypothetical protein
MKYCYFHKSLSTITLLLCDNLIAILIYNSCWHVINKRIDVIIFYNLIFLYFSLYHSFALTFIAALGLGHDQRRVLPSVIYHFIESPLFLNELPRSTAFDDSALLHHDYVVVVGDCIQAVGDGDHSGVTELLLYDGLDEGISLHIHVRSCLVQNQKLIFGGLGLELDKEVVSGPLKRTRKYLIYLSAVALEAE